MIIKKREYVKANTNNQASEKGSAERHIIPTYVGKGTRQMIQEEKTRERNCKRCSHKIS